MPVKRSRNCVISFANIELFEVRDRRCFLGGSILQAGVASGELKLTSCLQRGFGAVRNRAKNMLKTRVCRLVSYTYRHWTLTLSSPLGFYDFPHRENVQYWAQPTPLDPLNMRQNGFVSDCPRFVVRQHNSGPAPHRDCFASSLSLSASQPHLFCWLT